jgi:ribose transport system ATP-binding protein
VLRNGRTVGDARIEEVTEKDLITLMVQEEVADRSVSIQRVKKTVDPEAGEKVSLSVRGLSTARLHDITFDAHEGELVGLGGLQGQGQRELLLALFGHLPYHGRVEIFGEEVSFRHPRQAMRRGVALVPGERAREGLLLIRSILENLHLPSWKKYGVPLNLRRARADGMAIGERLNLVMSSLDAPVSSLSGGNAQKVVLGKWLLRDPRLLLLDDPTKGVDVGTKSELYRLLARLCEEGTTILFNSSDDDELLGLCDRVLVLHDGQIHAELTGDDLDRVNLLAASMGAANGNKGAADE